MSTPETVTKEPKRYDYVGVTSPTLIYIGIKDREAFDKIALPMVDCGRRVSDDGHITHALVKSVDQGAVHVFFQYWLEDNLEEWLDAKVAARRAATDSATIQRQ